jgi:hypothetical protein
MDATVGVCMTAADRLADLLGNLFNAFHLNVHLANVRSYFFST